MHRSRPDHVIRSSATPALVAPAFRMSSWLSWVGGKRDNKSNARDAIIGLREQLHLITKKEEYLQSKIDDEQRKARELVATNKRGTRAH